MTSGASKDHGPCAGWLDLQLQLCQFSVTGEAPVKLAKREGSLILEFVPAGASSQPWPCLVGSMLGAAAGTFLKQAKDA